MLDFFRYLNELNWTPHDEVANSIPFVFVKLAGMTEGVIIKKKETCLVGWYCFSEAI